MKATLLVSVLLVLFGLTQAQFSMFQNEMDYPMMGMGFGRMGMWNPMAMQMMNPMMRLGGMGYNMAGMNGMGMGMMGNDGFGTDMMDSSATQAMMMGNMMG